METLAARFKANETVYLGRNSYLGKESVLMVFTAIPFRSGSGWDCDGYGVPVNGEDEVIFGEDAQILLWRDDPLPVVLDAKAATVANASMVEMCQTLEIVWG